LRKASSNFDQTPPKNNGNGVKVGESLNVGAAAKQLAVSASTVRSWENLGLASPPRSKARYRLYSNDDLRVLRRAIYLRRVQGLNVSSVLQLLKHEGLLNRPAETKVADQRPIGPLFRNLRLQRGESLVTVAKAVGISKSFLSNIERSQNGASVGTVRKLAQHYDLDILDLFSSIDVPGPLVRPLDRKSFRGGLGVQMELLASGKITMEPHLFRVAPGAGSGDHGSHDGEEFLYLVRGRLAIWLRQEEFQLRPGDSFYFTSQIPHRWYNPGRTETIILWINTPAHFLIRRPD
jgi:DNA-binding transcriptional MerR regulator